MHAIATSTVSLPGMIHVHVLYCMCTAHVAMLSKRQHGAAYAYTEVAVRKRTGETLRVIALAVREMRMEWAHHAEQASRLLETL